MQNLMTRLAPIDLDFKGRIVAAFYNNPFIEANREGLHVRFGGDKTALVDALSDLCRCEVLSVYQGIYCFAPAETLYDDVASWCESLQEDAGAVRQQVIEVEALARLGEKLAVSQQEVSAILDIVPAGVLLLDRFGHLVKCNAIAKSILKVSDTAFETDVCALLGMDLAQLLSGPCYVEHDGNPPVGITTQPFRISGNDKGVVMALQDLTARRQLEAEADYTREAFFSMIRHELRKPLMTIERFLAHGSSDRGSEWARAASATVHLGTMIDDMLLLARLERDPMTVVFKNDVSLHFLLSGGDLSFRTKAQENDIFLSVVLSDFDVVFCGDQQRLGQVLGNLIDNAIKFTPRGGKVVLSGGQMGQQVWFSVQDTGPGIPEWERNQVFEKFYQVSSQGRAPGLGLGLAICRQIVNTHGGTVEIGDAAGGGAVVKVWLPKTQAEEKNL